MSPDISNQTLLSESWQHGYFIFVTLKCMGCTTRHFRPKNYLARAGRVIIIFLCYTEIYGVCQPTFLIKKLLSESWLHDYYINFLCYTELYGVCQPTFLIKKLLSESWLHDYYINFLCYTELYGVCQPTFLIKKLLSESWLHDYIFMLQ